MEESLVIICGTFLPPVVELINKNIKKREIKYLIALTISLILGAALTLISRSDTWILNMSSVFVISQTTFNIFWRK